MAKSKPYPAVVTWRDSACSNGWRDLDEVGPPLTIRSVGWVIRESRTEVVLSAHYCSDETEKIRVVPHADCMAIPREAVKSLKKIRLPRDPRA